MCVCARGGGGGREGEAREGSRIRARTDARWKRRRSKRRRRKVEEAKEEVEEEEKVALCGRWD